MSSYKNAPSFDSAKNPFDRYVEELRIWCLVTDIDEEKHGVG